MHMPLSLGHWRPLVRHLATPGTVALTFDDGPTPETTPMVLKLLAKAGAAATFFVSGVRAAAHPELVAAIVQAGHDVYGHGWDHVNLERDPKRAVADMRKVEGLLARHRPTPQIYLVRLPYNAGYARASMHRAMANFHPDVQFAWWSHSTEDYLIAGRCHDAAEVRAQCRAVATNLSAEKLDGAIILMHESPFEATSPFVPVVTEMLVPMILDAVAGQSLRAVTMKAMTRPSALHRWILAAETRFTRTQMLPRTEA